MKIGFRTGGLPTDPSRLPRNMSATAQSAGYHRALRGTLNTPSILAEEVFKFYCDIMNDDQPYMIRTDKGPIVATPYSNVINDFTIVTRNMRTTDEYRDLLIEELSVLHQEGEQQARIMNVGFHPHVSGRANTIRAVREFIEFAKGLDGVWWATREEIADYYAEIHESHIPGQLTGGGVK